MTSGRPEIVRVFVDLHEFVEAALMGTLRQLGGRTGDIFSFAYDDGWLRRPEALTFDPDLALVTGPQYPSPDRANFGIFLDSAPDRWGRVLMQKRENLRARQEGHRARSLTELGFPTRRSRRNPAGRAPFPRSGIRAIHR
jgi:serine/threonine-protein kinase HipA